MTASRIASLALAAALAVSPALAQDTTTPAKPGGATDNATSGAAGGGAGTGAAVGTATPGAPGAGPGTTGTGAAPGTGAVTGGAPAPANIATPNPVLTDSKEVRASKVIGATVYNDKNESVGTVDDILLSRDQKAAQAVLSVGGVLGVGAKLVAVPYAQLQFPDQIDNNTGRVMMPGATSDALNGMPTYNYAGK